MTSHGYCEAVVVSRDRLFPELGELTASQTIDAGSSGGALALNAQATSLMGGLTVWAVIVPPDYAPPAVAGDFVSTVDELPKVVLVDADATTKIMDGLFAGSYDGFTTNGDYTVIFYAKDSDNNLVKSAPVTITVKGGVEATTTTGAPSTTTTSTSTTTTTTLPVSNLTLQVSAGWSLLSSTIGFQATTVFADEQKFLSVWKWTDNNQGTKTWSVYLPGEEGTPYAASKGFLPLAAINSGEGFWVNSMTDQQVQVNGQPLHGPLTLTTGWNLVGIKATIPMAVTELGAVTSVWKWAAINNAKTWAVSLPAEQDGGTAYAAAKGFGQFSTIAPGEGFWVNKP